MIWIRAPDAVLFSFGEQHIREDKQMIKIKDLICAVCAVIGGTVSAAYGGWTSAMTTLIIFMAIDYATGIVVAGVFHASKKTESGALESKAGWKGLCRKGMSLLIVLVAARLDIALGTAWCKDAVVVGFIANETISILENAGLMGVKYPSAIQKALDVLTEKEGGKNE